MEIDDPKIVALREMVTAAQQEFDMAVTFHEVWKPAAYDQDLRSRLGKSYATQAFLITRIALRREMLLALMRLWDKPKGAVRMEFIAATLNKRGVIDALALDRVHRLGLPEALDEMRDDLRRKRDEVVRLVNKYKDDGAHHAVYEKLLTLRHERLAHRKIAPTTATGANATDEEIEEFYQDSSKLVEVLLGVVNAMGYDPQDLAKVYRFYAGHFWEAFRKMDNKPR